MKDDGAGVPYEVQYALKPTPDSAPLHWIEDTGRWFAGADGTPARAHGVVRVIDARREQEQQLAYLSRYDALTDEMNRWHMTAVLEQTIEEAMKLRSSCGFMLAAIDNLGRINEAYGFNIADEVIAAVGVAHPLADARQGSSRPALRQQVRHHPQQLHARRHAGRRRPAAGRRARPCGADLGRTGRRHRDHRRRHRAALRPQRQRGARPRAGCARQRQGEAARLVPGLSAQSRARRAAQGKRPRHRRDHQGAQRAPAVPGVRAGRGDRLAPAGFLRMPDAGAPRRRQPARGQRGGAARRAARPRAPARPSRARARPRRACRRARPEGVAQPLGGIDRRSGLVGLARRRAARAIPASPSGLPSRSPRRPRSRTSTTPAALSRA